jgi:hypothetical protein
LNKRAKSYNLRAVERAGSVVGPAPGGGAAGVGESDSRSPRRSAPAEGGAAAAAAAAAAAGAGGGVGSDIRSPIRSTTPLTCAVGTGTALALDEKLPHAWRKLCLKAEGEERYVW